jgi:CheY-like chemotaxis protein
MSTLEAYAACIPGFSAETVLVVEDEVFLRCAVGDYLRACGLHVIEAANALEAIRVLQTGLHIDVVFSDVQMPGTVDGLALANWIQREHPGTKVILTSGRAEREWTSGGRYLVLPKPYDHRDLEQRIRTALAEKQAS